MDQKAGRRLKAITSQIGSTETSSGPPVVVGAMVLDIQCCRLSPLTGPLSRGAQCLALFNKPLAGWDETLPRPWHRSARWSLLIVSTGGAALRGACEPLLLSVVGDDVAGTTLIAHWASLGLSTRGIMRQKGVMTPAVVYCFEQDGSVAAGIAAVASLETAFTTDLICQFNADLASAPLLILDGNLPAPVIQEACRCALARRAQIWFEPVSSAKSVRALCILRHLAFVSPNAAELVAMAQSVRASLRLPLLPSLQGAVDELPAEQLIGLLLPHLQTLLEVGVRNVVLTLGKHGAALCQRSSEPSACRIDLIPALPVRLANTSGAGDCLVAGACMRLLEGGDAVSALAHGIAAAQSAVQSQENVPGNLSAAIIRESAKSALRRLKTWELPFVTVQ